MHLSIWNLFATERVKEGEREDDAPLDLKLEDAYKTSWAIARPGCTACEQLHTYLLVATSAGGKTTPKIADIIFDPRDSFKNASTTGGATSKGSEG